MLLVVKCIFCFIIVLSLKEYWNEVQKKSLGIRSTFMQYLETSDTGKDTYSEDKVVGFRRRSLLKNGLTLSDKDPRPSQEFEAYCNKHGERLWNVGDPKPVHIQGLLSKKAQRKPLKQSQNGSLPPQFIEIKAVGTRF